MPRRERWVLALSLLGVPACQADHPLVESEGITIAPDGTDSGSESSESTGDSGDSDDTEDSEDTEAVELDLGSDDDTCSSGELEPRNPDEVVLCSETGEPLLARFTLPDGSPPAGGWPGIVVLHGSSGLFRPAKHGPGCSEQLHGRFRDWERLLTDRGYAVVMPDSFSSRGYCEWDDAPDDDEHERLVMRSFDAVGAAQWLCSDDRIDCARLGVLGFSNGASVALLVMHEQPSDAEDPRLHELTSPGFAVGVAYYPGCGLDSQLADQVDPAQIGRYFFPTGPVLVPHASADSLATACKQLRDPQVDAVADQRGIVIDMFELDIYPGAKHGFDGWNEGDPKPDRTARDAAETRTLAKLHENLLP